MSKEERRVSHSLYVHIPFCEHICHYCDFNKVFIENQPVDAYIDALIEEMKQARARRRDGLVKTIYVGGGTPTALTATQLERLFSAIENLFDLSPLEEWTVEVNPDSADEDKLGVMKRYGVNRLSIGAQTFNQKLLADIGRTHSPEGVEQAVRKARSLGFTNLSIDLMLGLPNQSVADFERSVDRALSLDVEHISAYALKIEKQTVFYNRYKKGQLHLPPEDDDVAMYELLKKKTAAAGLDQYEISNFGKPGYESKHNLVYWRNEPYAGFGAGASGYENQVRYQNINPVAKYIEAVWATGEPRLRTHVVSRAECLEEAVFLGLRIRSGINKADFFARYGLDVESLFAKEIAEGKRKGLLEENDHVIRLTENGLLLGNEAFALFVAVLEDSELQGDH